MGSTRLFFHLVIAAPRAELLPTQLLPSIPVISASGETNLSPSHCQKFFAQLRKLQSGLAAEQLLRARSSRQNLHRCAKFASKKVSLSAVEPFVAKIRHGQK
jgi:hypothetical protein